MKKIIVFIIFIIVLTSCAKEPVRIRYRTSFTQPFIDSAEKLVQDFNSQSKDIIVELEYYPFESRHEERIQTSFEEENEADVILYYGSTSVLSDKGWLEPIPEELIRKQGLEERFYPAAIANRKSGTSYYGIPLEVNIESPGLLINKDLFAESGLEVPDEWFENRSPGSWDEVYEIGKALTITENSKMIQSGLAIVNRQESSMFLSLIWQLGGDYRDMENRRVIFKSNEARDALLFMKNLISGPDRVHQYFPYFAMDQFIGGEAAMVIGAPWYAAEIGDTINFEYLNLPPFVEGSDPFFMSEGGWGLIVSSRSEHKSESWDFINFLLKNKNHSYWADAVGSIPSATDVGDMNPIIESTRSILPFGRDPGSYTGDTFTLVWKIVRRNLRSYLLDEITIDEALSNMEEEGNELIGNNPSSP